MTQCTLLNRLLLLSFLPPTESIHPLSIYHRLLPCILLQSFSLRSPPFNFDFILYSNLGSHFLPFCFVYSSVPLYSPSICIISSLLLPVSLPSPFPCRFLSLSLHFSLASYIIIRSCPLIIVSLLFFHLFSLTSQFLATSPPIVFFVCH